MRFGVLGPLAVWTDDGTRVTIPEAKVRALLADLLTQPGRVASTDRLIDDLWGDRPPRNPLGTLQARVSQLRKALADAEPGGRDLVVSRAPGYLLEVAPDAVDAGRFETLVAQARQAGDPRSRAALLADALALWRGPAYADFADDAFARAAIVRLDELRLAALEAHAEARLELGEHSLLTGELAGLVERHPLRERLRAAYMRALYRAGRPSEALATYGELRDRLRDELGLDPGPELAALHQAILEQDPALTPATSVAARAPRLPAALSGLIGRAEAVSEVGVLLKTGRYGGPRLVTLTGPGGVGKTRLAIETAREAGDAFPDGVWLVELTALAPGGRDVAELVAATLGVREENAAGTDPDERHEPSDRVADALTARRALLLLDNCEHVIEPVAELVERLLKAAPELQVLATSQEPLGLAAERVVAVPPLDLPDSDAGAPEELRKSSAVRMFVARAEAAAPGFAFDAESAPAVAAICRRLDGIPLALELAATRVRLLGVHELAARLDDRFRVLAAGHRGAPARQQTLRAMIDWSWELLSDPERTVLRRLAVHSEGATLDSAEAICAGDGVQSSDVRAGDVLDVLARLVDRSLVVTAAPLPLHGPRYRLLESVAAYALERLQDAGEERLVRQQHARYHADLAERAAERLRGPEQRRWLERLDIESANLRAALDHAARDGDAHLALRLVNAQAWHWYLRGRFREARRSLDRALSVEGEAPPSVPPRPERAAAVSWRAAMTMISGDGADPTRLIETALRAYEGVDDPRGRAMAEWFLSFVHWAYGDMAATAARIERALATFRSLGDRWGVAAALSSRATLAVVPGDLARVESDGAESLSIFEELGDAWGRLVAMDPLERAAEIAGDYERAGRLRQEGVRIAEELGLWPEVSFKVAGLGRIALLTGDLDRARELHERALRLAVEHSSRSSREFAEIGLGLVARRQGRLAEAEAHLRSPLVWLERVGGRAGTAFITAELGFVAEQRGDAERALALHLDSFDDAAATNDPRAIALALEGLAGARALDGRPESAASLLGTAAATRESVGAPLPGAERGDVDRITASARQALGDEAFATAFAEGRARTPEEQRAAVRSDEPSGDEHQGISIKESAGSCR
ncbi:BTAD domain-containing putative transcriptional regulator [Actinomadura rudentiformis]|uniref:AAA family ATPase n=1 Tax=Actinomadura rudentiformis TaxID=359158 RepID=A0A6H9Z7E5_9ACTN|nr:BTAD domain-containing putative transcriptional regulator [Actinomadura rudentiformis]KAB2350908.1 AAA family ATPase [Actinomadura rudentiformis]